MNISDYPFTIRHLSQEEGGGFLIEFIDLPGCMSDGETIDEAIKNGFDAAKCWISAAEEAGRKVPQPNQLGHLSGKWVQRVPKSLHAGLASRARIEGVSLNALVTTFLAESLERKKSVAF